MAKKSLSEIARENRLRDEARFAPPASSAAPTKHADEGARLEWLPVELLDDNPFQPRSQMSENDLVDLIESINDGGLDSPVAVHRKAGRFQLIFGHRRTAAVRAGANARGQSAPDAAQFVGLVPARVYGELSDVQTLQKAIEENDRRSDVSPLDRGRSNKKLRELMSLELQARGELEPGELLSWRDFADKIGKRYRQIHRDAQLLELPDETRTLLENGQLNARQGRAVVKLLDTPAQGQIAAFASEVARLRLTGEQAERRAQTLIDQASAPPELELPLDDTNAAQAKHSADVARVANRKALEESRAHLSLVTATKKPEETRFARREEDGSVVAVPVAPVSASDGAETGATTGNARWAKAIINGRLQPAALCIAGARQSFEMGEWGPKERKLLVAALEEIQALLDSAKKAL